MRYESVNQGGLRDGVDPQIAFINQELRPDVDALAICVVLVFGADLSPDEAARRAVTALENMEYMGHTLRADAIAGGVGDPKRTVFCRGSGFASRDEDLGIFLEGIVSGERGPHSAVAGDSYSDEESRKTRERN